MTLEEGGRGPFQETASAFSWTD